MQVWHGIIWYEEAAQVREHPSGRSHTSRWRTDVTASSIASAASIDHAALDTILAHLERRYGLDPRIDRAYRIVVSGRVALCADEPTTGLVHGDSGRDYYASVHGVCECPDAERVARCKHSLAVVITTQLAAVARSKAAEEATDAVETQALYAKLTREHQDHGRALVGSGQRPIDDPIYQQRDLLIQRLSGRGSPYRP